MAHSTATRRHEASTALIRLRREMGLTQQEFATRVMDCALPTIGLWESTRPPTGEVLIRLAEIAKRERDHSRHDMEKWKRFSALAVTFQFLRADAAKDDLAFDLLTVPKTNERDVHALAFLRFEGDLEVLSIELLHALLADLRSRSKVRRSRAEKAITKAIAALDEAMKLNQPTERETIHMITTALPVPQLDITGRPRRKRRQK